MRNAFLSTLSTGKVFSSPPSAFVSPTAEERTDKREMGPNEACRSCPGRIRRRLPQRGHHGLPIPIRSAAPGVRARLLSVLMRRHTVSLVGFVIPAQRASNTSTTSLSEGARLTSPRELGSACQSASVPCARVIYEQARVRSSQVVGAPVRRPVAGRRLLAALNAGSGAHARPRSSEPGHLVGEL